jgi:hypothetical protein
MGTYPPAPASHTKQTPGLSLPSGTTRCPKTASQHIPGLCCVPTKDTAVVRPTSLRMSSLLPVTCDLRKVTVTSPGQCVTTAVCRNGRRNWYLDILLLIGRDVGFRPLCEIVHSDQEISVSLVDKREGPQIYIGAFGSFSAGSDLPHRPGTVGTISRRRFLPEASSTVAESYSGFY